MQILFTVLALIISLESNAAVCSRSFTFSDGSVLTASQLNDEFNTAINCVNSIDNSNISISANIEPIKIQSTIAGDGIGRDGSTGVLSVNADDLTIELDSDELRVKDLGISSSKLAADSVTTSKILDLNVTAAKMATNSIATASIQDGSVTPAKLSAVNNAVSSSSGSISTSSYSFSDATNLNVNLTTVGRPVMLMVLSSSTATGTVASSFNCELSLDQDGTSVGNYIQSIGVYAGPPIPISHFVAAPSAGLHTYKVRYRRVSGDYNCSLSNLKLVAYEL